MRLMETLCLDGRITEFKSETVNGIEIGVVEGYLASFKPDRGGVYGMPDRFHPGAFQKSIQTHKARGDRPVRLKNMHNETIGGFPINTVREDSRGLFGRGEINLGIQLGREAYALARQGVLTDFSLGFIAIEDKIDSAYREIYEADIIEASIVDEPINMDAQVTEVKVAIPFQDLPLAPRLATWNIAAAKERVKTHTESEQAPGPEYKSAFVWLNEDKSDRFDAYKMQIADVIDDKLVAVPRAIFKAATELLGNNVGIPQDDMEGSIRHIERYYAKMGLISPFSMDEKRFFGVEEIKHFTTRDMERALVDSGAFSKSAAIELASKFDGLQDPVSSADIIEELNKIHL